MVLFFAVPVAALLQVVVLLQVVGVAVVSAVGFLERKVRGQQRGVCQEPGNVVQDYVVRKRVVAAVVSDHEKSAQEHSHQPIPPEMNERLGCLKRCGSNMP